MTMAEMVKKFQCPGCVCESNTDCGEYRWSPVEMRCQSHTLGTAVGGPNNLVALGLPKGFDKPGYGDEWNRARSKIELRLWAKGTHPSWDKLNVGPSPVSGIHRRGMAACDVVGGMDRERGGLK